MAPVKDRTEASGDLRSHLRAATMAAHDLLDAAMQAASGWQIREDYARFLELQHAARAPLEEWLAAHAPADLRPPRQTALIAQDLAALGRPVPPPAPAFALDAGTRGDMLGAAWVLAGSALGNRAIARQVQRIGGGAWPAACLDDGEAEGATRAATAVFAHFLAVAERGSPVPASAGAAL
jgi:heme oxygenase